VNKGRIQPAVGCAANRKILLVLIGKIANHDVTAKKNRAAIFEGTDGLFVTPVLGMDWLNEQQQKAESRGE